MGTLADATKMPHGPASTGCASGIGRADRRRVSSIEHKAHSRNSGYSLIAANPSGAMLRHGWDGGECDVRL
jgi:hypothetical protein